MDVDLRKSIKRGAQQCSFTIRLREALGDRDGLNIGVAQFHGIRLREVLK